MRTRAVALAILITTFFVLASPRPAEAQPYGHRPYGGMSIFVGVGFGAPVYWYHPAWFYGYPYRPFGYPWYWGPSYPPYPYYSGYAYQFDGFSVAVRLDADPVDTEVWVDGHRAGKVDDYDGVFQRLRLRPGEHEIVLYLDGYQTLRERRYFNPGSSHTIRHAMRPLAPGDVAEPRPGPPPTTPPETRDQTRTPSPSPPPREAPAPFGTLSIRVQPADAEVLIDGERFPGAASEVPIAIQLAIGRHKIEIRKDGYRSYVQDVLIGRDRTLTLSVKLTKL